MTVDTTPDRRRGAYWPNRELDLYPEAGTRNRTLGIVVLATVVLYYQTYLIGGVAVGIIGEFGLEFIWFVLLAAAGTVAAAAASHFGGFTDRYGRANIITIGLIATGLICTIAIPLSHDRWTFAFWIVVLNAVEGVILVASPALTRDFSPQMGRASAMGFWTLGPVLGSVAVTTVVGSGIYSDSWRTHYFIAGAAGLVIAVFTLFVRELTPALRDQVIVEEKDRALLEARVKGIDVMDSLKHPTRQMLKPDIVLASLAISMFLLFYIAMIAYGATFFQVVFGFSQPTANGVLMWAWVPYGVGLVIGGWLSDRALVRKPFMLVGGTITSIMIFVFASRVTVPDTGFGEFATIFVVMFLFTGVAQVGWLAAFTETVERRNPALTATGLAVWAMIIRIVFAAFMVLAPFLVNTVSPIVDHGATVQQIASGESPDLSPTENEVVAAVAADPTILQKVQTLEALYRQELETAATIDPATATALNSEPADPGAAARAVDEIATKLRISADESTNRLYALTQVPAADLVFLGAYRAPLQEDKVLEKLDYLQQHGAEVQAAARDGAQQWQRYFWIAGLGALAFIPMVWLTAGRWTPRRARADLREHEAAVARELAKSVSSF